MTETAAGSVIPTMKYSDLDEKVLIELCISSDGDAWRDAWSEIVARFTKNIYSVLRDRFSLPKEDIDDIYQNVCEKLMRNNYAQLKKFNGRSKFTTWLSPFTRNCGYDYIRVNNKQSGKKTKGGDSGQKKCENGEPEIEDIKDSSGETALKRVLKERESAKLKELLAKLPPRDRILLTLRYYEEKSYKDIARILNIPVNTVSSGLSRAIEKLKKLRAEEDDG